MKAIDWLKRFVQSRETVVINVTIHAADLRDRFAIGELVRIVTTKPKGGEPN